MLSVHQLTKRYGSHCAVDNISFEIKKGEVFGFLGRNGAGKTTTLRILAGILLPSSGQITIGGYNIVKQAQQVKRITGYIPDRPYLYGKLKARELLQFTGDLYDLKKKETSDRIDYLLNEFSLEDKQFNMIESFSHGMKQRLATCMALMHSPEVLIVDEPMVGLDPHGAKLMKRKFREFADSGMTVLLSTHSLGVAQEVAHRLAIVETGQIIAEGTFEELKNVAETTDGNLEDIFIKITRSDVT
jgi:ABC-2 type transport system ATP-binding protein